jgi:hypothetical protein
MWRLPPEPFAGLTVDDLAARHPAGDFVLLRARFIQVVRRSFRADSLLPDRRAAVVVVS